MAESPDTHDHIEAVKALLSKAEFELKHRDNPAGANLFALFAIAHGMCQLECTLHNLEDAILEAFQGPPKP